MNVREEAYRAAADAYNVAHRQVVGDVLDLHLEQRRPLRAAVDAVWVLAVAEGRRQAAAELRREVAASTSAIKRARLEAIAEWLDPTVTEEETSNDPT